MAVDHFTRPRPMAGNRGKHNARTEGKTLHSNAKHPGSCKLKSPPLKILCLLPSRTCHLNKTCSFVGCYSLGKAMGLIDKVVKNLRHPKDLSTFHCHRYLAHMTNSSFMDCFVSSAASRHTVLQQNPRLLKVYMHMLGAMHSLDSTLSHRR